MRCNFVVGQRVVCVLEKDWASCEGAGRVCPGPTKGDICTVNEVLPSGDKVYIGLQEWASVIPEIDSTPMFNADYFRPVDERKTDISCFTALLNPVKQREDA